MLLDPHRPLSRELLPSAAPDLVVTLVGGASIAGLDPSLAALVGGSDKPSVTIGQFGGTLLASGAIAYPQGWNAVPPRASSPSVARTIKAAGFDMIARADDHALDWGIEGMRATDAALDAGGLVHAGTGDNAALAHGARTFDHPGGAGRIALVSVTTHYRPTSEALSPHGAAPGRPGVAVIEATPVRLVPADALQDLRAIACRLRGSAPCVGTGPVMALGSRFEEGHFGSRYPLNMLDVQATLSAVRQGKQSSDLLVAWVNRGEDFPDDLAHAMVDAGADMVAGSGSGSVGAVEIYTATGRAPAPIFHDLGRFSGGADAVVARASLTGNRLRVDIHPVAVGRVAAAAVLERLRVLSAPYGTRIAVLPYGDSVMGRIDVAGER